MRKKSGTVSRKGTDSSAESVAVGQGETVSNYNKGDLLEAGTGSLGEVKGCC